MEIRKLGVVKEFWKSWRVRMNCGRGYGCCEVYWLWMSRLQVWTCKVVVFLPVRIFSRGSAAGGLKLEVEKCDRCDCSMSLGSPGVLG